MFETSISLNGREILRGDKKSIQVIFNNISGRNFTPDRLIELQSRPSHEQYLAQLSHMIGEPVAGNVQLLDREAVIDTTEVMQQAA